MTRYFYVNKKTYSVWAQNQPWAAFAFSADIFSLFFEMLCFHGLSVIHLHTSVDSFIKQFKRGHALSNKLGEYSVLTLSGSILVHFKRGNTLLC